MIRLILAFILLACASASAQVYTYTDADGATVFTDQPHKGAKRVDVQPSNRLAQPKASSRPTAIKATPKPRIVHYQMLRILVPLPDAAVSDASGAMIVTLTSDPPLQAGHRYQLLLDGKAAGAPGSSPVFSLGNLDRGAHQLSAQILDEQGNVIEQTPQQPVFMQRISLNQKRRMNPCKYADYGVRPECPIGDKPAEDPDA